MSRGRSDLLSVAPLSVLFFSLNIVFYMICSMQAQDFGRIDGLTLLKMRSSMRELMWEGEWVRLIAPNFLHVHMLHIMLNSMSLYNLGPSAEVHFGSSNFGTLYLLSGACGMAFSQIFGGHNAAGASAAIFGLLGAQLVVQIYMAPVLKHAWRNKEVRKIIYLTLFYFALGVTGLLGPIDNWAHLGGFVIGALFGALFEVWRKRRRLGLSLIVIALLAAGGVLCAARWSVFNPYYHLHMAMLAQEEKKSDAEIEQHLAKAHIWAKKWGREKQLTALLLSRTYGWWQIDDARTIGYRALAEHYGREIERQGKIP